MLLYSFLMTILNYTVRLEYFKKKCSNGGLLWFKLDQLSFQLEEMLTL